MHMHKQLIYVGIDLVDMMASNTADGSSLHSTSSKSISFTFIFVDVLNFLHSFNFPSF